MVKYPVRYGVLPNGMMFYAQPGQRVNLSGIGVRAGSLHTPPGMVGLPHLVEHLLARHSSKYTVDQINLKLLEYTGRPDSRNIRTDVSNTFYGHDMLANKYQMVDLFTILANLLEEQLVDADSLLTEKANVHEEYWLRGKDVAETEIWDMLRSIIFRNHPAGLRIDAEIADLKAIEPEDIKRFIRRHYVASNMFVVMFGPSYNEVSERVHRMFGHWPSVPPPAISFARYSQFRPLRSNVQIEKRIRGIHLIHTAIGFRAENYSSEDGLALDVLAEIWHHVGTTRLREQNHNFNAGTYRVYTEYERSLAHGLLCAWFATKRAEYADYGYEVLLEEAERLSDKLPNTEVFRVAQCSLRNQYRCYWGNVPLMTCEEVIKATSNGDPELHDLHNYTEKLKAVTRRDVRRVAQKYFYHPHGLAILRPR